MGFENLPLHLKMRSLFHNFRTYAFKNFKHFNCYKSDICVTNRDRPSLSTSSSKLDFLQLYKYADIAHSIGLFYYTRNGYNTSKLRCNQVSTPRCFNVDMTSYAVVRHFDKIMPKNTALVKVSIKYLRKCQKYTDRHLIIF